MKKYLFPVVVLTVSCLFSCGHEHKLEENYEYDESYHYKECVDCKEIVEKEEHHLAIDDEKYYCTICAYTRAFDQEKTFKEWNRGRESFLSHPETFSINSTIYAYNEGVLSYRFEEEDGFDKKEGYVKSNTYSIDKNGKETLRNARTEVVRNITADGKERTKHYIEQTFSGNTQKTGSYVSPDFLLTSDLYQIPDYEEYYYLQGGSTYEAYLKDVKAKITEDYDGIEPEFFFMENEGDIYSLKVKIVGEIVEDGHEDGYQNTMLDDSYTVNVKDGHIISFTYDSQMEERYENGEKRNYSSKNEMKFDYSFDREGFLAIPIETETTVNYYYSSVIFALEGYPLRNTDEAYVGENYTVEEARSFLANIDYTYISSLDDGLSEENFLLYQDSEYQIPYTGEMITSNDNKTIYVKLAPSSEMSVVITVFQNNVRNWVYLVYLREKGSNFDIGRIYSEYKILSIDGKEFKDGDSSNLALEENRTYVVVFDTPELLG